LDSKEVKIKDLNSLNGTFVNGKRISSEVSITATDMIKVGNAPLDWLKYLNERKKPDPPVFSGDVSAIKQKKTIGSLASNDIVLSHSDVSRNHAQLIQKVNDDIVIADSGSTNGTYVNGKKVSIQVLRAGDRVLIANKYPLDWENIFGKKPNPKPKALKTVLVSAAAVATIVIGIIFYISSGMAPEKIYAKYEKSVVMIDFAYYYQVYIDGKLYGNYEGLKKEKDKKNQKDIIYPGISKDGNPRFFKGTGTGFIVSSDGKIVTNRHIVAPWNYPGEEETQEIGFVRSFIENVLVSASMNSDLSLLSKVGKVTVEGKLYGEYLGIYLNDTHKSESSKIPCHVLKDSGKDEIDIGVIQINSKSLPKEVKNIVDLTKAVVNDEDITQGAFVYLMGFPLGEALASTSSGIKADHQSGEITQVGDEYQFRHNAASFGGASGSPVFNKHGNLIGIHHAGLSGTELRAHAYNMAIKAKYAVELAK
jgi:pSer/pThr/pTyr-binding forkhead associated (FHA) protein